MVLRVSTKANLRTLDQIEKIVRTSPGRLRQIAEMDSAPKVQAVADAEALAGQPTQATYFTFSNDKSRRFYFRLLYEGMIPFLQITDKKRVYLRQNILVTGWRVRVDARLRGKEGGLLTIENAAADALGRHYPQFVLPRPADSTSSLFRHPGFVGRWYFFYAQVQRRAQQILADDVNRAFLKDFRGAGR